MLCRSDHKEGVADILMSLGSDSDIREMQVTTKKLSNLEIKANFTVDVRLSLLKYNQAVEHILAAFLELSFTLHWWGG